MTINTKKVITRRELRFESMEEVLADAERLASGEVRTKGTWSVGQILQHLAQTMHASIDGTDIKIPWIVKILIGLVMNKEKMLNEAVRPGFKIPRKGEAQFLPRPDVSTQEGLDALRAAIERCRQERSRAEHPALGAITREEWDLLHLRHAEPHLSFVVPA